MTISSCTPGGKPNRCPLCGADLRVEPSQPAGDAPCPRCGHLLWFAEQRLFSLPTGCPWRPIRRIGTAGLAEVWQARTPDGLAAAIKILPRPSDPEAARRHTEALGRTKQLWHPFLLQTLDFWAQQDRLYIVTELADRNLGGLRMGYRRAGQTGIPGPELVSYLREAAEALDYLHGEQVRHGNIKPNNILLLNGHVKVGDFGWALAHSGPGICGTPVYMAPEVWGSRPCIHSDQYGLAATYAELRLGRRLFPGPNLMDLLMQHVSAQPDLDPLVGAEQQVLRRALAKDPQERYPSCREFVQELQRRVPG